MNQGKETTREIIKFDTEMVKLIWFALIADVGGTVSLMINLDSKVKIVLVSLGASIAFVLFWWLITTIKRIRKLINQLVGGE